jgi:hypothetical protein
MEIRIDDIIDEKIKTYVNNPHERRANKDATKTVVPGTHYKIT